MVVHSYVVTEREKEQAFREAVVHGRETVSDKYRSEETSILQHYIGYVGELVACREYHWQRVEPDSKEQFYDATDKDGKRIEIKTRAKFWADAAKGNVAMVIRPHPLHLFDLLYLFHYYVGPDKQLRIAYVAKWDREKVQRFKWEGIMPIEFWNERLTKGSYKVPPEPEQEELQKEEWQKVRLRHERL